MPLWRIFAQSDTFSYEQRAALARDVTALYSMLPAFYVNVIFVNTGEADVWVGGKPRTNFVRIGVEHIARKLLSEDTDEGVAQRKRLMDRINEVRRAQWMLRVAFSFCNDRRDNIEGDVTYTGMSQILIDS
jgi:hypothetical protein